MIRFLWLSDSCGFVDVGRSLRRVDGSVVTIAVGPCPHSHSRVRVPQDLWPIAVSILRLLQPGWPGPRIYILREKEAQLYPEALGFTNSTDSSYPILLQLSFPCPSRSYFATNGQSAGLSWYRAPIWGPWPDFYYCRTFAVLLLLDAIPDERKGSVVYLYSC
jgi:hypothetical protein